MNIKELAGVAGVCESITNRGVWIAHTEELERFAELVRQDEREACAKLCDDLAMVVSNNNYIAVDQRKFCAKQIRARGDKHD